MTEGMTEGMIGDEIGTIAGTIAGTIDGNAGKSVGAFATDLTSDGETLSGTGVLTSMTTASIATAAVITVKDSVEAIFRHIVNIAAMIDGNQRITSRSRGTKN
jgi:hypothetical protein